MDLDLGLHWLAAAVPETNCNCVSGRTSVFFLVAFVLCTVFQYRNAISQSNQFCIAPYASRANQGRNRHHPSTGWNITFFCFYFLVWSIHSERICFHKMLVIMLWVHVNDIYELLQSCYLNKYRSCAWTDWTWSSLELSPDTSLVRLVSTGRQTWTQPSTSHFQRFIRYDMLCYNALGSQQGT